MGGFPGGPAPAPAPIPAPVPAPPRRPAPAPAPAPAPGPDAGPRPGEDFAALDARHREELARAIREDASLAQAFQNWQNLSLEERVAAATRISEHQGRIYGYTPAPVRHEPAFQGGVLGGFTPHDGRVGLSATAFQSPMQLIGVLTHEQAHAYQHALVKRAERGELRPGDPLHQMATAWADNFRAYQNPGLHGYEAYRRQPVEAHAFDTGNQIAARVFGGQQLMLDPLQQLRKEVETMLAMMMAEEVAA